MKLSLSSSELLTQLQTATRVASTRSAVQALSGVMIKPLHFDTLALTGLMLIAMTIAVTRFRRTLD